jgi:hypothetical protein
LDESEVNASTLARTGQKRKPDVDSLAALLKWLGLQAESFLTETWDTETVITMCLNVCETRKIFTK